MAEPVPVSPAPTAPPESSATAAAPESLAVTVSPGSPATTAAPESPATIAAPESPAMTESPRPPVPTASAASKEYECASNLENFERFRRGIGFGVPHYELSPDSEPNEKHVARVVQAQDSRQCWPCTKSRHDRDERNSGLYRELKKKKREKRFWYELCKWMIFIFLFSQIALNATIASLGPIAEYYKVAITVLGALNTGIAGVLALVSGMGYPERLWRDMAELREVRRFIDREGMLLQYGTKRSPEYVTGLLRDVYTRYEHAGKVIEANRPDSWFSPAQSSKLGAGKGETPTTLSV